MTKKNISITTAMLITLSLPLAQAGVEMPGTVTVADLARETLAKRTLERAQASAAAVADEADQLRRIANPVFSPDSHRDKLTALKGKVNRMGQEISSLRAERESLAPWEQQAIDEILPLLQATAEMIAAKEMTARLEGEVAALRTGGRAAGSTDTHGQAARRLGHLAATIVEADRKACR